MRRVSIFMPCIVILTLLLAACGGASPTTTSTATTAAGTARATTGAAATTRTGTTTRPGATGTPGADAAPRIGGTLTVFAAASLTDAFNEIKARIEGANPGTTIAYNFAASSALRTQLEQGARADVFASADQPQLDQAKRNGVIRDEGRVFVQNKPVIIVPANNPRNIARPQDIANPGVKLVLAAAQVPIGNYARQILDNMGRDPAYGSDFRQRALANLVSDEANVRQVVSKVQLGEGDAGIVYSSDVTPAVRGQLRVIAIPDNVSVTAQYPVAVVRGAANEEGARAFIDYLVSPDGQRILEQWGFIPLDRAGVSVPDGTARELVPAPAVAKRDD